MKKVLLILLLTTYYMSAQNNITKIDSLLSYYNQQNKMLGQFSIKLGNGIVYQKAFGNAGDPKIETGNDTRYKIGSITKMFTATLIMQLVEEKKIKLTDKLSKFYPKVASANEITIEILLRHRSGILDYVNSEHHINYNDLNLTKKDVLESIYLYESEFIPNTKTKYSNSNYFLLGEIIEQITGKSYNDNLIAKICKPLNLYFTSLNLQTQNKNEIASYTFSENKWKPIKETNYVIAGAAGGIVSTANDLNTFINGLFSYKLVKKETLDLMVQTQEGFGLGITVIPFGDRKFYGHGGRIDGFETSVAYYPAEKLSFAALYNGVNTNTNQINIGVLSIYFHHPFTFPDFTDKTINQNILKAYEGIYKSEQLPIKINVFIKDGKLNAQAIGQPSFPLAAKSNTEFAFDTAKIKITFKKDEFILNQSDTEYLFIKE